MRLGRKRQRISVVEQEPIPETIGIVDENGDPILDEDGQPILLDARRMLDPAAEDPFFGRDPEPERKRRWFGRGEMATGVVIPREDLIAEYRIDRPDR